jgi:hypothetical protein
MIAKNLPEIQGPQGVFLPAFNMKMAFKQGGSFAYCFAWQAGKAVRRLTKCITVRYT